jgi:hypothetical protein
MSREQWQNPRDSSWHRILGVLAANDCMGNLGDPYSGPFANHVGFSNIVSYQYGSAAWNVYMDMLYAAAQDPGRWWQ